MFHIGAELEALLDRHGWLSDVAQLFEQNVSERQMRKQFSILRLPYWDGISSLLTGRTDVSSGYGLPSHAARLSWSLIKIDGLPAKMIDV
jgi:hypothetical protein